MRRSLTSLLACLVLGLLAAGCGDDKGDSAPSSATKSAPDAGGKSVEVRMQDIQFVPAKASVPVGGKIVWTNDDQVAHTVTKKQGPGPDFDSGSIDAGKTYEQTFTKAGTINYVCEIHPQQTGTITIK